MSVFEEQLQNAFNESEKIESTAKEVENRIKSIDGAAQYMPKRAYGTPVNGAAMSMTLKYLINSKDRQLAAYLNIADGTFRKMDLGGGVAFVGFGCLRCDYSGTIFGIGFAGVCVGGRVVPGEALY